MLAEHWPDVPRYTDVKTLYVQEHPAPVDILCGGFPCQDVSSAGQQAGLTEHTRSGLWFEYARIVGACRPKVVIVENVASGRKLWLPQVRRALHLLGYDSTAIALSARDVDAPHLRKRIFVVAYPHGTELRQQPGRSCWAQGQGPSLPGLPGLPGLAGDANGNGQPTGGLHAEAPGVRGLPFRASNWPPTPQLSRVDDGLPYRLDRNKALGNAVVPQCAECIGHWVQDYLVL